MCGSSASLAYGRSGTSYGISVLLGRVATGEEPYGATLRRAVSSALSWYARRTFHHRAFPADLLAATRERSASVLLPARNEAATIGPIVEALMPLREQGVVDQIAVLDDSTDGTGDIAAALGAEVYDQSALRPEYGPVQGKGDAMWRGLQVARGDVVCFLDADSEDFGAHFALGLLGPVLTSDAISFVKGFYRRPLRLEGLRLPEGGGRVTELAARPLLNRFFPELAGFLQPLAGEIAARRDLLDRKSTRLNSSHANISYAVFCLKKKKN